LKAALEAGIDGFNTTFIEADITVGGQPKFSSRLAGDFWRFEGTGRIRALNALANAVAWGAKPYLGVKAMGLAYDAESGIKTLTLSDGHKVQALAVVVATGESFRKMQFPGSDSRSVSYANEEKLTADGEDKFVVVVGGSDWAGVAALGVAPTAKHVYLLSWSQIARNRDDFEGTMGWTTEQLVWNNEKITVIEGDEIGSLRLDATGNAVSLLTKGGKEIPCNALGIFVGNAPNTEWLPPEIEQINGRVAVDAGLEASIPGVFAVGDVRHGGNIESATGRIDCVMADGRAAEAHAIQFIAALMARKKKPYFQEWMKDTSDWTNTRLEFVKPISCARCLEYSQIR
jgi:thioredoxin reductase (NADPH)